MPYKDKEKRRSVSKLSMQKKRQGLTQGLTNGVTITKERAIGLLKIAHSLDREIQGLGGRRENMLDLVRYGGISMREVRDALNTKGC